MSKTKFLILAVLISSFLGYLSLGAGQGKFIFQIESDVLSNSVNAEWVFIFPIVVLTIIGQVILIVSLFLKQTKLILIFIGISGIGMLYIILLYAGFYDQNYKMILSAVPFFVLSFILFRHLRNLKNK